MAARPQLLTIAIAVTVAIAAFAVSLLPDRAPAAGSAGGSAPSARPPAPPPAPREVPQPAATPLALGAFSAAREALGSRIAPAFARERLHRRLPVRLTQHYAGSEDLTAAIADGMVVDVGVFAHAEDVARLVELGHVDDDWRTQPFGGIACRSLVVLAVRAGNPADVRDWADLARPDLRIVCPAPEHSGGGLWNLCALYGAALRGHAGVPAGDERAAARFVQRVLANVLTIGGSASAAYEAFREGAGDVAITYESEVAMSALFGHDEQCVMPSSTLLVESPAVRIRRAQRDPAGDEAAAALLQFLWSEEGQRQFAHCGLRPVDPRVAAATTARFSQPEDVWTVEFLGGWTRAAKLVRGIAATVPRPTPGK